jgi:hypothetical protein
MLLPGVVITRTGPTNFLQDFCFSTPMDFFGADDDDTRELRCVYTVRWLPSGESCERVTELAAHLANAEKAGQVEEIKRLFSELRTKHAHHHCFQRADSDHGACF